MKLLLMYNIPPRRITDMHLEKFHYKYLGASAIFFAFMFMSILFFAYVIFTPSTSSQLESIDQALSKTTEETTEETPNNSISLTEEGSNKPQTTSANQDLFIKFPWCYESVATTPVQLEMLAKIPAVNAQPIIKNTSALYKISFPNENIVAQFFLNKTDVKFDKTSNLWVLNKELSYSMAQKLLETYPKNIRKTANTVVLQKNVELSTMNYQILNKKAFDHVSAFLKKYSGVSTISVSCDSFDNSKK